MQAQLELKVEEIYTETVKEERKGLRHYAKTIWETITKYIKYDKDAIFKDPHWPHLWS